MGRRIRHAPSATRRTPDPSFATETQQAIVPAGLTPKPQETSLQNSTSQKGTEFPLNESRDRAVTLLLPGQESFQLLGDYLIEDRRFRMTWSVLKGSIQHAPAREAGVRPTESALLRDLAVSRGESPNSTRQIQSSFPRLYRFSLLAHDRRRVVHFNVTAHPTAEWTAQQMLEAFPFDTAPRYLLRDRDRIYGREFRNQVAVMNITEVLSAPRAPWQRAYVERVIGSIRRECLDHVIIFIETDRLGTPTFHSRTPTSLSEASTLSLILRQGID